MLTVCLYIFSAVIRAAPRAGGEAGPVDGGGGLTVLPAGGEGETAETGEGGQPGDRLHGATVS